MGQGENVLADSGQLAPDELADTEVEDSADLDGAVDSDEADGGEPELADLEMEGEIAADYIEGLLDVADLDGDIDMDVEAIERSCQ